MGGENKLNLTGCKPRRSLTLPNPNPLLAYLDLTDFTPGFTWPCPLVYIAIIFSTRSVSLILPVLPVTQSVSLFPTSVVAAIFV